MAFQVTRKALNAAPYTVRMVKIGKPIESLREALTLARSHVNGGDRDVTVTDMATGEWCLIGFVSEYHNWRGVQRSPHVTLALPPSWADALLVEG